MTLLAKVTQTCLTPHSQPQLSHPGCTVPASSICGSSDWFTSRTLIRLWAGPLSTPPQSWPASSYPGAIPPHAPPKPLSASCLSLRLALPIWCVRQQARLTWLFPTSHLGHVSKWAPTSCMDEAKGGSRTLNWLPLPLPPPQSAASPW